MTNPNRALQLRIVLLGLTAVACTGVEYAGTERPKMMIAKLGRSGGDAAGFARVAAEFARRNPGYSVDWTTDLRLLRADSEPVVLFVQRGPGSAKVGDAESKIDIGDIVLLRPGESIECSPVDALHFTVPVAAPNDLPSFIRPDWDPKITDTPGGCATERGAYRRILLTWLGKNGPYNYHAINAHRVRIMDSFSHYHPVDKGFDEFYLVQMAMPRAKLITSDRRAAIESPDAVTREQAASLLTETKLEVGDLVYLPRELIHRGHGGVLAQVITVPGFVPGSEIGVDHHLHAINKRLGLDGKAKLPVHLAGAMRAIRK